MESHLQFVELIERWLDRRINVGIVLIMNAHFVKEVVVIVEFEIIWVVRFKWVM